MRLSKIRSCTSVLTAAALLLSGCAAEGDITAALQDSRSEGETQDAQSAAEQEEQSGADSQTVSEGDVEPSDNGVIDWGKVFQESGITIGGELIYAADWENTTAEIICTDPSCLHKPYNERSNKDPECSATVAGEANESSLFLQSILYNGQRIVFAYSYDEENSADNTLLYITDIYVCDPDGANRKKVASIDGAILSTAGLIHDGYLYCTVTKMYTQTAAEEVMENGELVSVLDSSTEDVLCSLNLDTWMLTEFKTKEGDGIYSYWPTMLYMDGSVYCAVSDEDVYRIDVDTQTGEALPDANRNIWGAAGGYLFCVAFTDGECQIMAYDVDTGVTECFALTGYDSYITIAATDEYVLGGRYQASASGDEGMFSYKLYDLEGNELGSFTYDSSLFPTYQVGEYIIGLGALGGTRCMTVEQLRAAADVGELENVGVISTP